MSRFSVAPIDPEMLYTTQSLAVALGVQESWIRRHWIHTGQLMYCEFWKGTKLVLGADVIHLARGGRRKWREEEDAEFVSGPSATIDERDDGCSAGPIEADEPASGTPKRRPGGSRSVKRTGSKAS